MRLRRRLIVVRLVEAIGAGALVGCLAGIVLMALLLWENRPANELVAAAIALGMVGGVVWRMRQWPDAILAARQADRQLGLSDLLASAWAVRHSNDPWARCVLAMAEQQCRTLSPSDVILRKFGVRAWSGLGLTVALTISLAMLASQPGNIAASQPGFISPGASSRASSETENNPWRASNPSVSRDAISNIPSVEKASSSSVSLSSQSDAAPSDGAGRGSESEAPMSLPVARGDDRSADSDVNGVSAAGGGQTTAGPAGANSSGGFSAWKRSDSAIWENSGVPDDPSRADTPAHEASIPDAYRDIVREFFNR